MTVPRATQENTNVEALEFPPYPGDAQKVYVCSDFSFELNYRTWVQYKSKTGGYELRPTVSNA